MPAYQTESKIISEGLYHSAEISLVVSPGTGNVQIQIRDAAGDFFTPADESYTMAVADVYIMPRVYRPEVRIIATSDAQFYVIGA